MNSVNAPRERMSPAGALTVLRGVADIVERIAKSADEIGLSTLAHRLLWAAAEIRAQVDVLADALQEKQAPRGEP